MKKEIAFSHRMKNGVLDDDYTLYDNGEILHEYDKHIYPGGSNLSRTLTVDEISKDIKMRLLSEASDENRELVMTILGLKE